MKKSISFLFFVIIVNLAVVGQQDPQFTNNMHFKLGVNPGYAGSENAISGIILNRYQWAGIEGAPVTTLFSVEAAIDVFGAPSGVGFTVMNDQLGFEKNVSVDFAYAFKTEIKPGTLGIGLSLGFFNKTINGEWYAPEGEYWNTSDPLLTEGEVSQLAFDIGLGLYLKANNYYLGASVTHLNQAAIEFSDLASTYLSRHYYLSGGYNIKLPDPLFELRPSFLFKSDAASWQMDLNANIVYDERLWGGLSYRYQDAISLLLGAELNNGLIFGYSFDLVTSAIGRYGYGSHEFFISYAINLEKNRTRKYKSIRFL